MGGGGAVATWIGNTTKTTGGQITHANVANGLPAATASCNDEFPGSHMCAAYEIYMSVVTGKFKSGTAVPQAWVYAPSWQTPGTNAAASKMPLDGLADNCAGYTYPTHDQGWTGVAFEWAQSPITGFTLYWHGGQNAQCNTTRPIACCK
jgi:hypothetical protein